ncbi:MAG: L-threonylcarbamoyladenylate synthase [Mariprofundaceae bacterium]|nr:L-threonylcarbamoyladenylate synthase [Mariprofundaceae bacterium]
MRLHPERPQQRQIRRVAELLRRGMFAAVPTETSYALMFLADAMDAQAAIRRLRRLDERHLWSLVCIDLSQAARYVRMDNHAHRILKRCLPGPYTFILPASSMLPKRMFGKRRDIGIRIPDHAVCRMLLHELGQPLLATSMQFPDADCPATDPDEISNRLRSLNCVMIDAGWGGVTPTTVVDLCGGEALLRRDGAGGWPA